VKICFNLGEYKEIFYPMNTIIPMKIRFYFKTWIL